MHAQAIFFDRVQSDGVFESAKASVLLHAEAVVRASVAILCFINLINYMDRYTVSGKSFEKFVKLKGLETF